MRKGIVFVAIVGTLAILAPQASAQDTVAVFITNISKQIISPPVVISHSFETRIFWPGQPASDELAALAEDGDPSALAAALDANEHVLDVVVADGPLLPGETLRFDVEATGKYDRISAVGMLVSTNDAFFGLDNYRFRGNTFKVPRTTAPAWDAGTEFNSEDCDFIPGPPCGSGGMRDTDGAEGFIHIHSGINGHGDLSPGDWNWQNPVVSIAVVK
jgi:hypothetical protein